MALNTDEKHPYDEQYVLCHHCDLLVEVPRITNKHKANCPRCHTRLAKYRKNSNQQALIYSLCSLFMLIVVCAFSFMNIRVMGVTSNVGIFLIPQVLWADNYAYLSIIFSCFILIFPAFCLLVIILLCSHIRMLARLKANLLVWFTTLRGWCMAEIFLAGVLVSFVKLVSYGDIGINDSFLPYCLFILLQIRALSLLNVRELWQSIAPTIYVVSPIVAGKNGISQNIRLCQCCHAILPIKRTYCPRCLQKGVVRDKRGIQWTIALLITAILFYIPSNIYSVMTTFFMGSESDSTILDGVIYMWNDGDYPVAIIIFTASMTIPILKIISLIWLCYFTIDSSEKSEQDCIKMNRLYNLVEIIGRWSMIDIFVVSVISALIRNGEIMSVYPNVGAIFFATVVIVTMIAASKYDPRLIWDRVKYV